MLNNLLIVFRFPLAPTHPPNLPLCDAKAFLRNIAPRFRFVDPLELTHKDERLFSTWRGFRECFRSFKLSKRQEIIIVTVKSFRPLFRMEPNAIFEHIIVKVTGSGLGFWRVGPDSAKVNGQGVRAGAGYYAISANESKRHFALLAPKQEDQCHKSQAFGNFVHEMD